MNSQDMTLDLVGQLKTKDVEESAPEYTVSEMQADTLFNFVSDLKYIIKPLQNRMLTPRYCIEDIGYMHIDGIKKIAFPMKCFCDINFHRLSSHIGWYGRYGLAFKKGWGLKKGIQPVQYINKDSRQRKDFTEAFNAALKNVKSESQTDGKMESFLLEQLMFYKPYDGKQKYPPQNKVIEKCFADECEWRYVPDVSVIRYTQLYYKSTMQKEALDKLSDAMDMKPEVSLHFDYDDLKYIILESEQDFEKISEAIMNLKCEKEVAYKLLSKIVVWDEAKEDF